MILNEAKIHMEKAGVQNQSTFSIRTSAKAFSILSSGVYSNKIAAVVRELSCNAYDAHVANGNPEEPFIVHLPTLHDPEFYVRDFGTGIHPDAIIEIYTTYFASTKDQSNDFTGALGIGSKSPFAYTSNFNVSNFYNGKKYDYFVFLDENSCPCISLVGEVNTDERNGLKVSFSVEDSNDVKQFESMCVYILSFFSTTPTIIPSTKLIPLEEFTKDVHIVPHKVFDKSVLGYLQHDRGRPIFARMGNIIYHIRNTEVKVDIVSYYPSYITVIDFAIGELDFTTSRESLEYTDRTISAINSKMKFLSTELQNRLTEIYNACPTRLNFIEEYVKGVWIDDAIRRRALRASKYDDRRIPIDHPLVLIDLKSLSHISGLYTMVKSRNGKLINKPSYSLMRINNTALDLTSHHRTLHIVIDDNTKNAAKKLKQYKDENGEGLYLYYDKKVWAEHENIIREDFPNYNFTFLSTITLDTSKPKIPRSPRPNNLLRYIDTGGDLCNTSVHENEAFIYVKTKDRYIVTPHGGYRSEKIADSYHSIMFEYADIRKELGLPHMRVYYVSLHNVDKVKSAYPNAIDMFSDYEEMYKKYIESNGLNFQKFVSVSRTYKNDIINLIAAAERNGTLKDFLSQSDKFNEMVIYNKVEKATHNSLLNFRAYIKEDGERYDEINSHLLTAMLKEFKYICFTEQDQCVIIELLKKEGF